MSEGFILFLEKADRKFIRLNGKIPFFFKKLSLLSSILEGPHFLSDMPGSIHKYSVKALSVLDSNVKLLTEFLHPLFHDFICWISSKSPCQLVHETAIINKNTN